MVDLDEPDSSTRSTLIVDGIKEASTSPAACARVRSSESDTSSLHGFSLVLGPEISQRLDLWLSEESIVCVGAQAVGYPILGRWSLKYKGI